RSAGQRQFTDTVGPGSGLRRSSRIPVHHLISLDADRGSLVAVLDLQSQFAEHPLLLTGLDRRIIVDGPPPLKMRPVTPDGLESSFDSATIRTRAETGAFGDRRI